MSRCVVPGCLNRLQEWTTLFPCSRRLLNRWVEAIKVGTGQEPVVTPGARICKAHFSVPPEPSGDFYDEDGGGDEETRSFWKARPNRYQEPTLFFRDNILTQVVQCQLCCHFSVIDDMYKPSESLGGKETLKGLVKKYFNYPKKPNTRKILKGYFCEGCVVHIDMIHSFWLRNHIALKDYRRTRGMMANTEVVFDITVAIDAGTELKIEEIEILDEVVDNNVITIDDDSNDAVADTEPSLEDTIVKEEPQLAETVSWDSVPVIVPPDEEISVKCFICNNLFDNRQVLTEHIAYNHKRTRRVCTVCQDEFYSALSFNDHMDTHVVFRCNHCPLQFSQRRDVVFHEITQHIGQKLVKACDICGKLFRCRDMLNSHRWTEHGQA